MLSQTKPPSARTDGILLSPKTLLDHRANSRAARSIKRR